MRWGGVQLCLTLNQGCEALIRRCGRSEAQLQLKRTAQIIQNELNIPAAFLPGDGFSTGNRFYDSACIAARVYSRDAMPPDAVLHGDLEIFYGLYGQYYEKFISVPDHDNDIIYNKGFDLQEAVVLLDVYIKARQGGISMTDAAAQASAKLRNLARARGLLIADSFRSAAGLQSRIRCIGYLYEGRESTSLPGTQVFREAVALYKGNRDEFERLLKGADAMPAKPPKPPSPPKPPDVPGVKPAVVNETRFVRTAGDQALKAAYGGTFRDVYCQLKRATDGKQVRLTATDIYKALDRRARRRDIIEILDGASWARKVDDTPHYIFYDAERGKRKAQELEDIDDAWVQSLHAALDGLFRQADAAYVIPRDIRGGWLGTLPAIVRITGGNCYVREGPGTQYKALDVAQESETYSWLGEQSPDGWLKIRFKSLEAWVSGKYGKLV